MCIVCMCIYIYIYVYHIYIIPIMSNDHNNNTFRAAAEVHMQMPTEGNDIHFGLNCTV